MSNKKTIAIDFDGVIHQYSKGWKDGSIYDPPIHGSFEIIARVLEAGHSVFIFSSRNPGQIKKWLKEWQLNLCDKEDYYLKRFSTYKITIIPFWKKFWNERENIGITKKKLPAHVYIDDRGFKFENWEKTKEELTKLLK